MDSLIGTSIGGYKLTEAIGSGTTGQVFAAADSAGSQAAIKILHPNLSLFTKVQAYWDELQKVGELSHPHITVASAADWSMSGRFYLAMDYLEGKDLHETLVDHGKLPPSQVLRFVGQICLALEAVHELGLHHGAVKPHNIHLIPKGDDPTRLSTRLTDFSSSQLLDTSKAPDGALGGAGVPNPKYLAPEQFKGEAAPAADIYALGVVLYEALSGRPPFVGSYEELAEQHANATPETPANAPEELAAVALKAMAKDPAERFADINAFREALEAWAAKGPVELKTPGLTLFSKDDWDPGVGFNGETEDQTVRVSVEELEAVFEDDHKPSEVEMEEKQQEPAADKAQNESEHGPEETLPQDDELAAIAEQASTALRKEQEAVRSAEPAVQEVVKPAPKVEGYMDEDGDLVELPLERSVRAFVANISPTVPTATAHSGSNGNGESLDAALDSFVQEAKAWSAALPPPTIDDHGLAELAKVPVVEPEPEPEPIRPEPVATPMVAHEPPPQKSVLLPALIAAVVGGLAVFGGMKLFGSKPVEPPPAAATSPGGDHAALTPTPVAAGGEDAEPAAPVATSLSDSGATGATAASEADTGAAAAAPGADAAPAAAATTEADAGATAEPGAEPKPAAKPSLVAKSRRKRARRAARRRAARRKARARRKPRTASKPRKKPKKKAKPAGKKSDWVDPFAQ